MILTTYFALTLSFSNLNNRVEWNWHFSWICAIIGRSFCKTTKNVKVQKFDIWCLMPHCIFNQMPEQSWYNFCHVAGLAHRPPIILYTRHLTRQNYWPIRQVEMPLFCIECNIQSSVKQINEKQKQKFWVSFQFIHFILIAFRCVLRIWTGLIWFVTRLDMHLDISQTYVYNEHHNYNYPCKYCSRVPTH